MRPNRSLDAVLEPHVSAYPLLCAAGPSGAVLPVPKGAVSLSFEAVYRSQVRKVVRWVTRLLGPGADVEDVVQEVFLVVRRKLPQFRGDAVVTTWLYEITVRAVQEWRRQDRWWAWITGRGQDPTRGRKERECPLRADSIQDPEALIEARESARRLYQVLDELSEVYRTTFILFELEGLSGEQIAEITGTRLSTVWVRLSRARQKFLQRMRAWEGKGES